MKNNKFHLKILTPNGIKFSDDIDKITFLASSGYITNLKNHSSISGTIEEGKCTIFNNNENFFLFHSSGAFSFIDNILKIIVDKCDDKELVFNKINLLNNYNNKIIIGNNEIVTNHHSIKSDINKNDGLIEFEFKKLIKNIK